MKNLCNGWDVQRYPFIHFTPDERVQEKYRAWQGCPTIAITKKGRLFAGWYTGGEYEPCILNYNVLVKSDDAGVTWSDPLLTVNTDCEHMQRKIDIQLWTTPENHLWVMWTASPYYETSKPASVRTFLDGERWDYHKEFPYTEVMVCKDPDADELVWEKPRYLCDGFTRCRPIVTSGGRIIVPAYDYNGEKYTFHLSDDGGETFTTTTAAGKPDTQVYDELTLCEEAPGKLWFLARTNRGMYVRGESHDNGNTWTDAEKYEDGPSTRCFIGKLQNGMTVYVRNIDNVKRTGFRICLSEDGGKTFPHQLVMDERDNVSYPDVVQDQAGNIYVIYDRERDNRHKLNRETWVAEAAKEILLCRVTVEDILAGKPGENALMQKTISKGGCHFAAEVNVPQSIFVCSNEKKNVLLIGDSIRMGYIETVQKELADVAEVFNLYDNCQNTQFVISTLSGWRDFFDAPEKVDVVHFNCGHWDVAHWCGLDDHGTSLPEYERNIGMIVKLVRKLFVNARVLFATTTTMNPNGIPGEHPRTNEEIDAYNAAAVRAVSNLDVPVNDLNAVTRDWGVKWYIDTCHFTDEGYEVLGKEVAARIREVL